MQIAATPKPRAPRPAGRPKGRKTAAAREERIAVATLRVVCKMSAAEVARQKGLSIRTVQYWTKAVLKDSSEWSALLRLIREQRNQEAS